MMMNCKEATKLSSKAEEGKLNLWSNLMLKMHLFMCKHCGNFAKQINFLRKNAPNAQDYSSEELSSASKEELKNTILKHNSL